MSDDLRAKIDWSQWKLCTLSGIPDETRNLGIQWYMYPRIVTWHAVYVPMFDTEEQAMQWVIDGGQYEIKLKYDEEGKPI